MFKIIGTYLVLITVTQLTNGQVTLSESKAAKDKAVRHILSKRQFNHGWDGGHTIRVVTGLQLAEDGWYKDNATIEESASVRQRDAEILSVFAKDPNLLKTAPEVISEWVNSIISTCQDPAKFHGVNLIDILKKKLDTIPSGATRHAAQTVAVSLALCNAGVQVPNSAMVKINNDMKPNKGLCNFCIEGSSLTILAMQCIKAQQPDNKLINGINTRQIAYLNRILHLSLLNYTDDTLDVSRTISDIEENFVFHKKIGLKFNAEKSEIVAIGKSCNRTSPDNICADTHPVPLSPSINYLGLPIGSDMRYTRSLLLEFLGSNFRKTYGIFDPCKAR